MRHQFRFMLAGSQLTELWHHIVWAPQNQAAYCEQAHWIENAWQMESRVSQSVYTTTKQRVRQGKSGMQIPYSNTLDISHEPGSSAFLLSCLTCLQ